MRFFLHVLRVLCYIAAFISLFNGSIIIGFKGNDLLELLVDLGMAIVFIIVGLVFSYLRSYVFVTGVRNESDEREIR